MEKSHGSQRTVRVVAQVYSRASLTRSRLLFGDLFTQGDDYVLRVLVSDILRHLLANNYEIHELWEQSSEDVMDFPTSQELDAKTVSKILHSISASDVAKAFKEERYCASPLSFPQTEALQIVLALSRFRCQHIWMEVPFCSI